MKSTSIGSPPVRFSLHSFFPPGGSYIELRQFEIRLLGLGRRTELDYQCGYRDLNLTRTLNLTPDRGSQVPAERQYEHD